MKMLMEWAKHYELSVAWVVLTLMVMTLSEVYLGR